MACGVHDVHLEMHSAVEALEIVQVVAEQIARRLASKLVFVDFSASPGADPTELIVRVRDQGTGVDPAQISDPLSPENVLKTSGRDIFLMRQFMDDVSMHPTREGGMEVRMLKRIRR